MFFKNHCKFFSTAIAKKLLINAPNICLTFVLGYSDFYIKKDSIFEILNGQPPQKLLMSLLGLFKKLSSSPIPFWIPLSST